MDQISEFSILKPPQSYIYEGKISLLKCLKFKIVDKILISVKEAHRRSSRRNEGKQTPTIFVSEGFLKREQTRLLLDYDDMPPSHDEFREGIVDDDAMEDVDTDDDDIFI